MSSEVKTYVKKTMHEYLSSETKVRESLTRNGHMNRYKDQAIDIVQVKDRLSAIVDGATCSSTGAIAWLNELTSQAKVGARDDVTDAIIVDFINHVAMKWGIDYALYTSDL